LRRHSGSPHPDITVQKSPMIDGYPLAKHLHADHDSTHRLLVRLRMQSKSIYETGAGQLDRWRDLKKSCIQLLQ